MQLNETCKWTYIEQNKYVKIETCINECERWRNWWWNNSRVIFKKTIVESVLRNNQGSI